MVFSKLIIMFFLNIVLKTFTKINCWHKVSKCIVIVQPPIYSHDIVYLTFFSPWKKCKGNWKNAMYGVTLPIRHAYLSCWSKYPHIQGSICFSKAVESSRIKCIIESCNLFLFNMFSIVPLAVHSIGSSNKSIPHACKRLYYTLLEDLPLLGWLGYMEAWEGGFPLRAKTMYVRDHFLKPPL